ncbi:ABC transporter permease [Pseudoclavibacter sp. RFBB5]|uniref:ABC transporter permease n=1 Tax=Pseudoclavibacter sp. RFBB5 TaxID=2080574 RepID=UPI000CE89516|nr:ABC transporter permease [Pseudoclavibacter sp. RFBB5]PPG33493.1 ABC transporter permease [Pseudoclavibacter sp. RFBB5]
MLMFILRRVASSAVILVSVCCAAYALLFFSSSSIARNLLGPEATPDQVALKEAELGLDEPFLIRLAGWWAGAVQGDFGTSWVSGQPVFEAIGARLPVTLVLVTLAVLLTMLLAVILAAWAAVKRGILDQVIQVGSIAGTALPAFLIGLILVTVFAIQLGWLPAISTIYPGSGLASWASSLALPILALLISGAASTVMQLRSAILRQLDADYVRTLRSRGIDDREILFVHVLRSAAPAALTLLGLQFVGMLGGVVVIEQLFAIAGIGTLAVSATSTSDAPLVMGIVLYTIIIVIIVNLLVDLMNGWLNPKARAS